MGTAEAGAAADGPAGTAGAPGATPLGGNEGNLIVGAEVGFGGNAMRTVSFFGCTFAASGGVPPGGGFGIGSAIKLMLRQRMGREKQCQIVNARVTQET